MKIGIIADSHDNLDKLRKVISIFRQHNIDYLLHCGDFVAPFTIPIIKEGNFKKCFGVFGNNDGEIIGLLNSFNQIGELKKAPHIVVIDTLRILLLHEPLPDEILTTLNYDIITYGHTHQLKIKEDKPIIINPGELSSWITGKSTAVIIDTKELKPEVITL